MEDSQRIKQQKIWQLKKTAPTLRQILADELGISLLTAQLLINRGFYTVEQGRAFFDCAMERLYAPALMKDLLPALTRINRAVRRRENILIYGDYDVDGITATVLLYQTIRRLGGVVAYDLPDRMADGYGLHLNALRRYHESGVSLVITVDCGISSVEEAAWATENGLDLIITDHHLPPSILPRALAVVNPKRADCDYPFKELAGVGVALKLAQALLEENGHGQEAWLEYLDLCCLGTIADIVPLQGENRILVKHGLERLARSKRPGVQALLQVSGIKGELKADTVAFQLAPRLNAAGRVGRPDLAARLLLSDKAEEARQLADELQEENNLRQNIEADVLREALAILERRPEMLEKKVLVLAASGWNPGVIGIVASRLMERFYRPVLLIAWEGDTGRGSARSISQFHLHDALSHCRELLLRYGGHAMAAGFSISRDNIEAFYQKINRYADAVLDQAEMVPNLYLDALVELGQVSEELVKEIQAMQPFGAGNPAPLFGCREALLGPCRGVGKDAAHLKMSLLAEGAKLEGIAFGLGAYAGVLAANETVDLAFEAAINEFRGRRSLQLTIRDLERSALLAPTEPEEDEKDALDAYIAGIFSQQKNKLLLPEFIYQNLPQYGAEVESAAASAGKGRRIEAELLDLREVAERQAKLSALINEKESVLIVTNCGYKTIEIRYLLEQNCPALRDKVVCCHRLLSENLLAAAALSFQTGEKKVMVATPAMAVSLKVQAEQVIIYHLPYSGDIFNVLGYLLKPYAEVHLLFNTADLAENRFYLAALAPDRTCLARMYTMFRRRMNDRGQFSLQPAAAARQLVALGLPAVRDYTVLIALQVFAELGLLEVEFGGEVVRVRALPPPAAKRDLNRSPTYVRLQRVKEQANARMTEFLRAPLNYFIGFGQDVAL